MVTSIPRRRVVILVLATALVGGCGIYRKRSANKAIQRVEEKSEAQAREAEANRFAPETFNELQRHIQSAKDKVAAGQYEEAIQEAQRAEATAQRAITEAKVTKAKVQAKQNEIQGILKEANAFLTRAREAPPTLVPETEVAAAEEDISVVQGLLKQQAQVPQQKPEEYDAIVDNASAAFRAAQHAYNLTLKEQASDIQQEVDALRDEAVALQPEKYLPEETKKIQDQWDEFDRFIREEQYEEALGLGENLKEVASLFISATREKRAEVELGEARSQRDKVVAQGASRYALEPMKLCERALTEAEKAFEAGQMDETYDAAVRAQQAAAQALTDLETQAADIVARVGREIEAAETEGALEHAPETLEEAKELHGESSLARERNEILESIETGRKALERAAAAILQTKKLKAQAALERSQRSIDVAIEEGAPKYAPTELTKAQEQHSLAEQQFKDGAYTEVHDLAAEAEKLSAQVLDALEKHAQDALLEAEADQQRAVSAQADILAAETLEASRQRLAEGQTLLGSRRYRRAIELAAEASELAREAEATSYRLRSEEMMARAEEERAEAEKAGARDYAGQTYNLALDGIREARSRYEAGEYAESLDHATRAVELAITARRKRLDAAIAAVNSASDALGLQYATETFREAVSTVSKAKQDMEERNYADANQAADRAAGLATRAETASWKARSEEKSKQVTDAVTYLTDNLAETKCPDDLTGCRLLLADTNRLIETGSFREGYERGVEAEQAAGQARACLAEQAVDSYEGLSTRSEEISALAMDPHGRAEAARLYPLMAGIKTALGEENYRVVFEQAAAGMTLANEVGANLTAYNVDLRLAGLQQILQDYKATGQAAILPHDFAELEAEVAAQDRAALYADYQEAVDRLDDLQARVDMFAELVDMSVSKQLLSIKQALTEARHAGALKYVRGTYENAVDLYKKAVVLPAGEDYHQLAQSIQEASAAATRTLSKTLVSIDETGYKENIRNYMLELNSLLDRWPFAQRAASGKFGIELVLAARSTQDADVYHELQRHLSDREFRDRTEELYTTVQEVQPPPTMENLHQDVLTAFQTVSEAADLFMRYGLYSLYGQQERERFLREAYGKLNELEFQIVIVQARLENLPPPRKKPFWGLLDFKRGMDPRNYFWIRYEP